MSLADDMAADAAAASATPVAPKSLKRLSLAEQMLVDSATPATATPGNSPVSKVAYSALKPVTDRIGAFGSGANSGMAVAAGLPVDTAANILDLGKAAIGSAYGAISGNAPPSMFDPMDRTKVPGSASWIKNKIEQTDTGNSLMNNNATEHPYFHAAGTGTAMAVAGGSPLSSLPMVAASTAGAQYIGDKTGNPMLGQLAAMALPAGAQALQQTRAKNAIAAANKPATVQQQTLQDAQELGFKAPPSQSNGSTLSQISEGIAGKAKTAQTASDSNQAIVNKLVIQDLGLPENSQITPLALRQIRKDAGQHYENVKQAGTMTADTQYQADLANLSQKTLQIQQSFPNAKLPGAQSVQDLAHGLNEPSFTASAAVSRVQQLRADARSNTSGQNALDPATKALGTAQQQAADALDGVITRNLTAQGRPDLASNYISARTTIAKTHTYEDALNEGTGNISLKQVAKNPALSGDMKTAANFYNAFPRANQNPSAVGGIPSVSPLDLYGSLAAAGAGGVAMGPAGVAAGLAVPLARYAALKSALRSKGVPATPELYSLSSLITPTLATSDANRNRK